MRQEVPSASELFWPENSHISGGRPNFFSHLSTSDSGSQPAEPPPSLSGVLLNRTNKPRFLYGVKLQWSTHSALCGCRQSDTAKLLICAVPRATAEGNLILYLGSVWSRAEQASCVSAPVIGVALCLYKLSAEPGTSWRGEWYYRLNERAGPEHEGTRNGEP